MFIRFAGLSIWRLPAWSVPVSMNSGMATLSPGFNLLQLQEWSAGSVTRLLAPAFATSDNDKIGS